MAGVGAAVAATSDATEAEQPSTVAPVDPAARIERRLAQEDVAALARTYPPPPVTASGWLVYDAGAREPIAGVEASTPRPIASLAKLMTALVVVDRLDLDTKVTIPAAVNDLGADASRMDARAGEQWRAGDLLQAMLVHSANDAALALATHVGDGSEAAFVELMNERAAKLGMADTRFASSTGLDSPGRSSTSTPVDLAALAEAALAEQPIADAVALPKLQLARPGGGTLEPLPNRNPLLGRYDGVDGVKTGFTDAAGYMLVAHHEDDATGGTLLVVTFASTDEAARAADSRKLLDWARPLRQRLLVVEGGTPLGTIPVQRSDEQVEVFACDDLVVSARVGQRLVQEVVVPRSVVAPVQAGDELGELRVRAAGEATAETADVDGEGPSATPSTVGTTIVPVCAGSDVAKLGRWDRIVDRARDWRSAWTLGADEVEDAWSSLTE